MDGNLLPIATACLSYCSEQCPEADLYNTSFNIEPAAHKAETDSEQVALISAIYNDIQHNTAAYALQYS